MDANDLKTTIVDVVAILSVNKLEFHLTGGLASSFYGEPRFTQDIDIVVRVSMGSSLERLISDLSKKFIIDGIVAKEEVGRGGLFQALHEETMIKIDFHVGEAIKGELNRSRTEEILPGVKVPLVSKEDAILSKLIWIKKGSHKSRQDIKMMLKRSGAIDSTYLDEQSIMLGVQEILGELRREMEEESKS